MNLLLFDADERTGDELVVRDRRATHLRSVLKVALGDRLRVGEIGGGKGHAEVIAIDADGIRLRIGELVNSRSRPACAELTLAVAVPRPKVVPRMIAAMASFGVARIELINAWRVDKSFFSSPALKEEALIHAARLGSEQGGHTQLPSIEVYSRFMLWLEEVGGTEQARCALHPRANDFMSVSSIGAGPVQLAIGPERGWIDAELESLESAGFAPVCLTSSVLRVESAIAAALGQLELLRANSTGL